jgi:hypothetical protein
MKKIMVNIESEEDYEAIDELRTIINGRFSDKIKIPKLFRDRILIEKMNRLKISNPQLYQKICSLSLKVRDKARELRTGYRLLSKKKHSLGWLVAGLLGLIATFPLFLYGNIFNLTFLQIPNWQSKKIKDIQFRSSIKFGYSFGIALVLMPVILALMLIFIPSWWIAILFFLSLPLSGFFAWNYFLILRRITGGFRIREYIRYKNDEYFQLKKNHNELVNLISGL